MKKKLKTSTCFLAATEEDASTNPTKISLEVRFDIHSKQTMFALAPCLLEAFESLVKKLREETSLSYAGEIELLHLLKKTVSIVCSSQSDDEGGESEHKDIH